LKNVSAGVHKVLCNDMVANISAMIWLRKCWGTFSVVSCRFSVG
jgi:hypothetical protein